LRYFQQGFHGFRMGATASSPTSNTDANAIVDKLLQTVKEPAAEGYR
jgi:hypothetical protein